MKKRFTLLFAALLAFVGVAKADFTQTWTTTTDWGEDLTDMPEDVATLKGTNSAKALISGVTVAEVAEGATVKVGFTYTSGSCALNVIGVDLMTIEGEVVASQYVSKKAGGDGVEQLYTLSGVPAGNYFVRYFVWYGSDDRLNATNGNIKVTGASEYEFPTVTFTYNYKFEGVSKATKEYTAYVGLSYPAPSGLPYGIEASAPYGKVKDTDNGVVKNIYCSVAEDFPFKYAEEYSAITKWYYLKLKGSYLFHEENAEYLATGKTAVEAGKETAYAWAFVGNPFDGFMLVNNAAGEGYVLSSTTTTTDGNTGGDTYPLMTELPVPEGNNTYWMVTPSPHAENGFYLAQKDHANNRMNDRGKLAYWNQGADAGSTFVVETPDLSLSPVSASVGDVAIVEGKATVESISSFDITFDRPVALNEDEDAEWAVLTDSWGDNSLKAEVLEDNNSVVRFSLQWEQVFTDAGDFYLYIPAGLIVDAATGLYANSEIAATITVEGGAEAAGLSVTSVTVGEDVMATSAIVAQSGAFIYVNFDGTFYFSGTPAMVDANGDDATEFFQYQNGRDYDGSNAYILIGMQVGTYTITLPKASFATYMPDLKVPAEDVVLTVQIVDAETAIESVEAEAETVIYDLSGRRVEKMEKGIYIVNGKKVIK